MDSRFQIMSVSGIKPKDLVALDAFETEQDVIDEGIRKILRSHPEYRLEIAITQYQKEDISLGKAASVAGISIEEMRELLSERDIPVKGAASVKEVKEDAENIRNSFS